MYLLRRGEGIPTFASLSLTKLLTGDSPSVPGLSHPMSSAGDGNSASDPGRVPGH